MFLTSVCCACFLSLAAAVEAAGELLPKPLLFFGYFDGSIAAERRAFFFPFSSKILWMGVEKMTLCLSFPIQAYLYFLLSHFTCTTTATTRKLPSALFAALTRIAELPLDVVSPSLHI